MSDRRLTVPGFMVVGSDTGVGKTQVTCAIARQLKGQGVRVGVYKPVASGFEPGGLDDGSLLWEAAGQPASKDVVCPQKFREPLAPHLAARAEDQSVDAELLRHGACVWNDFCDFLVVEGVGGLMSPLTDDEYVADLAFDLGLPLVVVVPNQIGVLNQTLQTLIAAATFRDGLEVLGIVLNHPEERTNDPSVASNRRELELRCVPPVLAELEYQAEDFSQSVDWLALVNSE